MSDSVMKRAHKFKYPGKQRDDPEIVVPDFIARMERGESHSLIEQPPYLDFGPINGDFNYTFFQTVANPTAVSSLREREKELDKQNHGPVDAIFYFDLELMSACHGAIPRLARGVIHRDVFQYPRVDISEGYGNIETEPFVFWPVVNVFENRDGRTAEAVKIALGSEFTKTSCLYRLLSELSDREVREKADYLVSRNLNPLAFVGGEVTLGGREIKLHGQPFKLYKLVHQEGRSWDTTFDD